MSFSTVKPMPELSVIIPVYNKADYICRALRSVLNQTYQDFEVVVVDDGSTDNSVSKVSSIEDNRIRLIRQENHGVSAARNTGIAGAKGNWIAFLDADDEWHPKKIERQMYYLEKYPDVCWASCGFSRSSKPDFEKNVEKFDPAWFQAECLLKDGLVPLSQGRHFWTGTVLVHRKVFETVQPFNTSLRTGEDIDFFFRMACGFPKLVYLTCSLAHYNTGVEGALTSNMDRFTDASSIIQSPKRIAAYGADLQEPRKQLAAAYAGCLLQVLLYNLVCYKKYSVAQKVLIEARKEGMNIQSVLLKLRIRFPWLAYFDIKAEIRHMLRMLGIRGWRQVGHLNNNSHAHS